VTISRGIVNASNEMNVAKLKHLTILSAGSAGAKSERLIEEMKYNSFSIYSVKRDSIDVESTGIQSVKRACTLFSY
jgi:hypothetical protein